MPLRARFSLLILLALASTGCSMLVAVIAPYVEQVQGGDLSTTEDIWFETAYEETLAALRDGAYEPEVENKDALSAAIKVVTPEKKKKAVVRLFRRSDTKTEIRIRVGRTGDEEISRTIMKQIRTQLK